MKVRNYLENIAGVGVYPVTTLLLFFLFFTLLTMWVLRTRKQEYTAVSHLPLDGDGLSNDQNELNR